MTIVTEGLSAEQREIVRRFRELPKAARDAAMALEPVVGSDSAQPGEDEHPAEAAEEAKEDAGEGVEGGAIAEDADSGDLDGSGALAASTEDFGVVGDAIAQAPVTSDSLLPSQAYWSGVIGMEGETTGDGRLIEDGALSWDVEGNNILMRFVRADFGAHDGAVVAGHVRAIERRESGVIWAEGDFDMGSDEGREAYRQVREGLMTGISMDIDDVSFEVRGDVSSLFDAPESEGVLISMTPDDELMVTLDARIRAITLVAVPAFATAHIALASELESETARANEASLAGTDTLSEGEEDEEDYAERSLSPEARQRAADNGEAMPDGCLSAETEVVTPEGLRRIDELAREGRATLLTEYGWIESDVMGFGVQPLMRVTLEHEGETREVLATPGHHWLTVEEGWVETRDLHLGQAVPHVEVADHPFQPDLVDATEGDVARLADQAADAARGVVMVDHERGPVTSGAVVASSVLSGFSAAHAYPAAGCQECVVLLSRESVLAQEDAVAPGEPALISDLDALGTLPGALAGAELALGAVTVLAPVELGVRTFDAAQTAGDRAFVFDGETDSAHAAYPSRWEVIGLEPTDREEDVYCALVPDLARFTLAGGILTGNSFPIRSVAELRRAIQASGRAADGPAARRHIMRRARDLDQEDLIPDNWNPDGSLKNAADSVTAAAAPVRPPASWFDAPDLPGPTPITVSDTGRVFGHLATWDACHIASPNGAGVCVMAPRSHSDYAYFHTGSLITSEGETIGVGHITMGTGHADPQTSAIAAAAHYDNTGSAVADVRVGEDHFGIWIAGAVRPHVNEEARRVLRASPLSGDWRRIAGSLELVAALAVNVPGFPIPRPKGLVASGELSVLVAAGMLAPSKVIAPGLPGAFSASDLKYLKRILERERKVERDELAQRVFESSATLRLNRDKLKLAVFARRLRAAKAQPAPAEDASAPQLQPVGAEAGASIDDNKE